MPYKVLFISHVQDMSGAEINLLRFLSDNNQVNPVIVTSQGKFEQSCRELGLRVYRSYGLGELRRQKKFLWPIVLFTRFIITLFEISRIILREKPDIIQPNNVASLIYSFSPAKLFRVPVICYVQGIFPIDLSEIQIYQLLGRRIARLVAVSNTVKQQLVLAGIASQKINVIYNGIDVNNQFNPKLYSRGALRNSYQLSSDILLIGMIGLLVKIKGFHLFVEAINFIQNDLPKTVKFFIIGDSWVNDEEYKQGLLKLVNNYHLNELVYFTGRRENIAEVLKDLDIVIHSSSWVDSLSLVVLEAMAMEKITISANIGETAKVINDMENGILYLPDNAKDLGEKLLWAIKNSEKLKILQEKARDKIIAEFDEKLRKQKMLELYKDVCTGK